MLNKSIYLLLHPLHFCCFPGEWQLQCFNSMEAKTNECSSNTPDSAYTINAASMINDDMYYYLKQFYEKVSDDPGGQNLTFLCKLFIFGTVTFVL